MAPQGLRVVAAASFLPAFPLLVAHGVVSHSAVPASGLIPLAISSGLSFFMYRRNRTDWRARNFTSNTNDDQEDSEQQPLLPNEAPESVDQRNPDDDDAHRPFHEKHPFLIFLFDLILAAAILAVLVFTWLGSSVLNGQLAMLAAYGTVPLLISFFIHVLFAVRALSSGLALPQLTTWVAWQIVPGDCPGCGHHLRPESTPDIPWVASARRNGSAALETVRSWEAPAMPNVSSWARPTRNDDEGNGQRGEEGETVTRPVAPAKPAWLRRHAWLGYGAVSQDDRGQNEEGETARLFVDPEASQYRDDDHVDRMNTNPQRSQTPPEVVVVGKKKQRKAPASDSPSSPNDNAPW